MSDPTIGTVRNVDLARTEKGFVASWAKIDVPDAGTDPTPALAGFEVVDLDERGVLVKRELVATPGQLRAKKGSIEAAGISREEGATFLYWIESVTSTDPDGRVRTAFGLRGAYGDDALAPPSGACERCSLTAAVVTFADETIAIVRTTPDYQLDVTIGNPPPPPVFTALHFRRDAPVDVTPLPFLSVLPLQPGPGERIIRPAPLRAERDRDGRIVVTTEGRAWRLDRSLNLVSGPIALPATDARALWGPDDAAPPSITWSISPTEEGRSTAQFTRREIFLSNGAARDRLSHGRTVFSAERRGDEVGVFFESSARAYFATASATGKKHGGDVFIRNVEEAGSQYGDYDPLDATVVTSPSAGHFTIVELGRGKLFSTEIVCAP